MNKIWRMYPEIMFFENYRSIKHDNLLWLHLADLRIWNSPLKTSTRSRNPMRPTCFHTLQDSSSSTTPIQNQASGVARSSCTPVFEPLRRLSVRQKELAQKSCRLEGMPSASHTMSHIAGKSIMVKYGNHLQTGHLPCFITKPYGSGGLVQEMSHCSKTVLNQTVT